MFSLPGITGTQWAGISFNFAFVIVWVMSMVKSEDAIYRKILSIASDITFVMLIVFMVLAAILMFAA